MTSTPALAALLTHIEAATGADRSLDAAIDRALRGDCSPLGAGLREDAPTPQACLPKPRRREMAQDPPAYTASVDHCLELLHELLPDWHWHIGRGAHGIMPYASLSNGEVTVSADGTTVPQVLLAAIVKALRKEA